MQHNQRHFSSISIANVCNFLLNFEIIWSSWCPLFYTIILWAISYTEQRNVLNKLFKAFMSIHNLIVQKIWSKPSMQKYENDKMDYEPFSWWTVEVEIVFMITIYEENKCLRSRSCLTCNVAKKSYIRQIFCLLFSERLFCWPVVLWMKIKEAYHNYFLIGFIQSNFIGSVDPGMLLRKEIARHCEKFELWMGCNIAHSAISILRTCNIRTLYYCFSN